MQNQTPIKLDERIFLIDGFDLGVAQRTGTYVIDEDELTLVETGPSPAVKHIKQGLASLGLSLDQVQYIIVTHIHLDHAGGAGVLIKECPNAQVVVHPRGERHLEDPTKLAAGARAIYGESFAELFDPIVPIAKERLLVKTEGDTLQIGSSCRLQFLDTPGHSKHHFSIYDPVSHGVFTGDTVGIRYAQLAVDGLDFFLPTTSPNHFNPDDMYASIERIKKMDVDRIYFGHFGMTEKPKEALNQVASWLDIYMEEAEQIFLDNKGYDDLAKRLSQRISNYLQGQGVPDHHDVYVLLNLDMQLCSLGMIDYFNKIKQ